MARGASQGKRDRSKKVKPALPVRVDAPLRIEDDASAIAYLRSRTNIERMTAPALESFKLDRMRALCELLGRPERATRFVHVAGSKGKGSVVEMLGASLSGCGYTVGAYTSPHLVHVRERIRIGSRTINETQFAKLLSHVAGVASDLPEELGEATYFELLTGTALLYFADLAVDAAVLEVGLGGRLDATNVIDPELCVITSIHLEHTNILGETLEEIATEKAGILKTGVSVITVQQEEGVLDILREHASTLNAEVLVLGEQIDYSQRFEADTSLGPHMRVGVSIGGSGYEHLACPIRGQHQAANCGLALAALLELRKRGFETPEREVAQGLAKTLFNGRFEQVWEDPRIIIDGAHTPESVNALIRALGAHLRYDSLVVVFGCAQDKNVEAMLDGIAGGADKVFFTRAEDSPRALDAEELATRFGERHGKMAQAVGSVKEAINDAYRATTKGDLIVVTGSFHVAGEAKRLLMEKKGS